MISRWSISAGCCAALLAGCAPQPAANPKPVVPAKIGTDAVPVESAKPKLDDNDVVVTPVDAKGLQAAVAKHAGKLVLVDCWATWCVPCVKAFPHTVELSRQHANDGLVVLSLSFDDPADGQAPEKVRKFLKSKNAPFAHYISTQDLAGDGAAAFDIPDGSLPHFKLYGRDGNLLRTFAVSEDTPEDAPELHETVAAAVVEALKAE